MAGMGMHVTTCIARVGWGVKGESRKEGTGVIMVCGGFRKEFPLAVRRKLPYPTTLFRPSCLAV